MSTTRRTFLATGLSAGAAVPLLRAQPSWLHAAAAAAAPSDSVLVVVQIRGGWDQLQMMPEVEHPKYVAARPNIKLAKAKCLTLKTGSNLYWHPAMKSFKDLYDRGDLSVVQNIGYPKPNLSHFVSEKKWYAADPTTSVVHEGWLATWLKKGYTGTFQMPAIDLESRLAPAFFGERVPVFYRVSDFQFNLDSSYYAKPDNTLQIETLAANAKALRTGGHPSLLHVANSTGDAVTDSALLQTVGSSYAPKATYPSNSLGNTLKIAARYITGGLKTRLYYTNYGGFDNHANEVISGATETGTLATRLSQVTDAIKAFLDDIKAHAQEKRVVVMVFSEFGRRLGENGSLGTDHGHGGMAFMAGAPVNGGRFGTKPDLSKATTPYNRYYIPFDTNSTDFRRMYWDALTWLGVTNPAVVLGSSFTPLGTV